MFTRVYVAWDCVDEQLVAVKQLIAPAHDECVVKGVTDGNDREAEANGVTHWDSGLPSANGKRAAAAL
jgi:hypothetical protein